MKRNLAIAFLLLVTTRTAYAQTYSSWVEYSNGQVEYTRNCMDWSSPTDPLSAKQWWDVRWKLTCWNQTQPTYATANPSLEGDGVCRIPVSRCPPVFSADVSTWTEMHVFEGRVTHQGLWPWGACRDTGWSNTTVEAARRCDNEPPCPNRQDVCQAEGDFWDGIRCIPIEEVNSPIIVDVRGNGYHLAGPTEGVPFDLNGDGTREQLAWTEPMADDAFLVLDRNANGTIDDGTELFGNHSPQPLSATPNGFAALAVFDANGDKWIDEQDPVYDELRLWTDSNHDGVAQTEELTDLVSVGILRISLSVQESRRRDRSGNLFRYRSNIVTNDARNGGPFIYDVFLVGAQGR